MGPIIHVLYIQTETGGWYAQCLDVDVAAQGRTQEEAERSFFATWHMQAELDRENGRPPFSGLGVAPKKYQEMAKRARWSQKDPDVDLDTDGVADESSGQLPVPPAYMIASMPTRDSIPSSAQ